MAKHNSFAYFFPIQQTLLVNDIDGREFFKMPHTSDNDKKAKDNNALRHEKNMMEEKNRKAGKNQYSKKTDHL